ncbi:MAG: aspartate dehydrogenase, partial [Candidatus Omnitrophota bacterium]
CGTIGSRIAAAVTTRFREQARLVALADSDAGRAAAVRSSLVGKPPVMSVEALIKKSDLVIEAASAKVSGSLAKMVLSQGKNIMVMSVGGVMRDHAALHALARRKRARLYLPSGALCGLDGVKAASMGPLRSVRLTTTKPPAALADAPFFKGKHIDLTGLRRARVVFDGSALEAIEGFPANINVACALSLAGLGPRRTRVRIIADPAAARNIHEVTVEGTFGRLTTRVENLPSPGNPRTSYLAVLSALATLKSILDPITVGT